MNFTDKREMERFSLKLPALLSMTDESGNQRVFVVMIINICAGGSFFKIDKTLLLGTDVKMKVILPLDKLRKFGGKKSRIHVSGWVIRTNDQGVAVCFDKEYHISPLE